MKRTLLGVLSCCVMTITFAQNIVKEHYTVSGGLLGAANFSEFRVTENNPSNIDFKSKTGWSLGAWVNFPVGNSFSIEPQVMYSSYRYLSSAPTTEMFSDGKIGYVSIPVLLKFHIGDKFALTAGPQVDFMAKVQDNDNSATEEDFKQTSWNAFGGFELFPHGRVTVFGRYVHGLTNLDNRGSEASDIAYKNQNIQAGLKLKLFGKKVEADSDGDGVIDKKDKCPNEIGVARYDGCPIPDKDGDGINDEADRCPDQAGTAKYNGCPIPDSDGDGINDELDKCPNQKGTAKYEGCPIPDKDNDGINDEEDRCPDQAGPAERNGCPVLDRDKDGINDEEDRCPDVPGAAANKGCPDVPANVSKTLMSASGNIAFTGNTSKLTSKSNASLNQIVAVMNENPSLRIRVEGHTGNAGDDEANMSLSQAYANSVKNYLVSKGISEDRIKAEGFGETMPIADNSTTAGRNKNRRVEIKIEY